ncbi:MAG: penicillin-binding protein 2 [Rhodospirillaceae bacterium]|jgi:penicillin-binding protein 2|nr:penicillin-binding protein 2 [Rhodospirillaceae bacterium]MBT5245240.1 penicillin-binding protein 2 [Rhodospirillaceae bacterium]MBT5562771.1 penicillin-binding protein 2 [Rhodospirillaceae bacterium]MBT6240700.1 penicillin-binding protein 2 [Rhodospirillaceae bacterium]
MHRDSERHKQFSRRTAILAGGKAVLLSALVGRMYYLQVVEADRYKTLAEDNRISFRLLAPPRGRIVDRFGVPIADNQQNYRVVLVPEQTDDVEETLIRLGRIIPIRQGEKKRILRDVGRSRGFVPVTLRENLSWEDVAHIEVNTPDLPGVMIDVGQSRFYPFAREMAHILGYVAAVSEGETGSNPLLELPGFRIGKSGIEKVYDLALRGAGGSSQVEVNAFGRVIRELKRSEGQPGTRLQLTIDSGLQQMTSKRLGEKSGSVVVMDVHSGDVLAMVSTPGFDPNAFNKGLSTEQWNALISNDRAPLTNKSIAGNYAPGSTFKMIVALAALEKGVISAESEVFCTGKTKLGNATFHCWKKGGHGVVNLNKGISQSCDVYFYDVARRTGIERIAEMARRFGLGEQLGLDLPGERAGLIPSDEWKRGVIGAPWQKGETLLAGIGQGYVLTTPLQLAVMTARLANGGVVVNPHLTRNIVTADGVAPRQAKEPMDIGLVPGHLALVREAMETVVNQPTGTAFRSRIRAPEFRMAGKTGTAQVRRISKLERENRVLKNDELPWKERDHALFVGYAPIAAPRYAVSVVIEHGGGGSRVAAPIARDVLEEAQRRDAARPGEEISIEKASGGQGTSTSSVKL